MPRCLYVGNNPPNVVNLTRELVRINSVPHTRHSNDLVGEAFLAHWLKEYLEDYDFRVDMFPVEGSRSNVLARHEEFNPDLPTIAFEAHLDTVSVEGMVIDPFAAELRDGRVYGRGASDVKGTMAVMLAALLRWYKVHAYTPAPFNLVFLATMGEEGGTRGSRELARRPIPLDMILVGEPTGLQPVIGHNGTWRFTIVAKGETCHSSTPKLGVNAIEVMAPIVAFITDELKPGFEAQAGNSMNMTLLQGGEAINIIPGSCSLTLDCRYQPGTPVEQFREKLVKFIDETGRAGYQEILLYPPFKCKESSRLLPLIEASLKACDIEYKVQTAPWYSDAGPFSAAGYDTILWGVGDMRQAHTRDEFIETAQLDKGLQVLMKFLEICKQKFQSFC